MYVVAPADAPEVKSSLRAAINCGKPTYIRIGKKGEPVLHQSVPAFHFGRWSVFRDGEIACLLSTGNMLSKALETADALKQYNVEACVVNCASVKPLDESLLTEIFHRFKAVATLEEHSLIGGFGSAVAEWAVDHAVNTSKLIRFGTRDIFLHRLGEQEYSREQHGLSLKAIVLGIQEKLNRL
jgi:transketolase